jgi:putative DNA primase/helicase
MSAPRTTSARAAARYIERGWAPVPIPARQKGPQIPGWQRLRMSASDVPRYFIGGQNIGIITGKASGWLVTVDLDCPEAVTLAGRFLKPTLTGGRQSVPDGHWWYISPGLEHREFEGIPKTPSEGTILELRSTDHQTVVEPSVHPSGERYRWSRSGLEPLKISAEDLTSAVRCLAASALIACHLPESKERGGRGGRYHYALALAGYLLRHQEPQENVEKLLKAAWDAKGWRGIERHRKSSYSGIERAVRDTAQKLRRGDPTTGGRTLEGMVQGLPRKIADFLGWERFTLREGRGVYLCTDTGNAERLVDRHGANLRYCHPWGKWLIYDGTRWHVDDRGAVVRLAKDAARSIFEEAKEAPSDAVANQLGKWASSSLSESKLRAMISLAQSEPGIPVLPDELDASPDLLNVLNGTIDLRSGKLREHRREDLITRVAPLEYDPDANAPAWETFLQRVLPGEELRAFVQRAVGYSATGHTSEQCMFINHGGGANGKSTFQEALSAALGDYAMRTPTEMLLARRSDGVPNDVARLKGARFVSASETEEGRRLAESRIKDLTGQDTITARFMKAEWFDFAPTHKLWLSTNHKPEIRGTDAAIWRRIRLVPWTVSIPPAQQDKKLPEKLRSELPTILAWVVRGCLQWRRKGLQAPEEVRQATGNYRSEMDVLAAFLEEYCILRSDAMAFARNLYIAYKEWCEANGEPVEKQRRFGMRLTERGLRRQKVGGVYRWYGIGLRHDGPGPSEDKGPADESATFAGNSSAGSNGPGPSGPENHVRTEKKGVREDNGEIGPDGPDGPDNADEDPLSSDLESGGSATLKQLREIRKLVGEGMAERLAREEILGKGWVQP